MMKICTYPDPVLRAKAEVVKTVDDDLLALIKGMGETMYAAPGIGLAANQIGSLKRVLIYDLNPRINGRKLSVIINPEIVQREGEIVYEEACLSVIDYSAEVKRHARVKVTGYDQNEKPVDIEAEDLLAICLQHEIDHLNGRLFIDHISTLKRALYKKKIQKMLRKEND
ncbi:MAG: peptide deformylase [Deltaproteobacteria bacterium]|nr:peptide deformylase [Deltaproteobacteria bacterium]